MTAEQSRPGAHFRHKFVDMLGDIGRRARTSRSQLQTLDEVFATGQVPWVQRHFNLDETAAAWLLGVVHTLRRTHPSMFDEAAEPATNTFIYLWATMAPKQVEGRHINEGRFERWLDAARDPLQADNWYRYSLEALKIIRGLPFNVRSLYDIAAADRYPEWPYPPSHERFEIRAAVEFYEHQPPAIGRPAPRYRPVETILGGR